MPTSDYSLDDVTATVLSTVGPGFTTETDLVKKKKRKKQKKNILITYIQ